MAIMRAWRTPCPARREFMQRTRFRLLDQGIVHSWAERRMVEELRCRILGEICAAQLRFSSCSSRRRTRSSAELAEAGIVSHRVVWKLNRVGDGPTPGDG